MSDWCIKKKWSKIWEETYKLLRIREHQRTQHNYNCVLSPGPLLVVALPEVSWGRERLRGEKKSGSGLWKGKDWESSALWWLCADWHGEVGEGKTSGGMSIYLEFKFIFSSQPWLQYIHLNTSCLLGTEEAVSICYTQIPVWIILVWTEINDISCSSRSPTNCIS